MKKRALQVEIFYGSPDYVQEVFNKWNNKYEKSVRIDKQDSFFFPDKRASIIYLYYYWLEAEENDDNN